MNKDILLVFDLFEMASINILSKLDYLPGSKIKVYEGIFYCRIFEPVTILAAIL